MKPKSVYATLCFAGAVIPYWQFVPWIAEHGLNPDLFARELFANRISSFFALDVFVSALAVFAFGYLERRGRGMRFWWLPVLATLSVGVSLGLPLALYLREIQLENFSHGA